MYNGPMDMRLKTRVLPGRRIEVETPELAEGEDVEVTITATGRPRPQRSMLDLVRSLNGHRLLQTPADADRYLRKERDSWDR